MTGRRTQRNFLLDEETNTMLNCMVNTRSATNSSYGVASYIVNNAISYYCNDMYPEVKCLVESMNRSETTEEKKSDV